LAKTFLTGATGHVGANLVRALLGRGEDVRCFVRRAGDPALEGLPVDEFEGDLRDPEAVARGVAGCDRVYHVAAYVSLRPGDKQQIFDVNVLGTKHVLDASQKVGVARVVFCSSFGAVGRNPNGGASDETCSVNPFDTDLDYELSKAVAEIEVHRAVAHGLDAVIVNPSGVVGAQDYKPSAVGKTLIDFARRRIPAYVPGAFEFVAVRDVVAGHLLAMEKGRSGHRYILSGEHHTLDEILVELERITGVKRPRFRLPPRFMSPIAHVSSAFMASFFPTAPPRFTPGTIKILNGGKRADTTKARRELGYAPTPVFAAFQEQYDWFRARGVL
jgi:nucleoside-diphosphate-sugar epimerase